MPLFSRKKVVAANNDKFQVLIPAYMRAGLPDGIFSYQKIPKFCYILDGLGVGNLSLFAGHFVYLMVI
jgi:hypothetical protein